MTLREFVNAWIGWAESRNEEIEAIRGYGFFFAQYNASRTAWSKKQSKSIMREKAPWESKRKRGEKPKVLNYDEMRGLFEGLAEKRKN